MKKYETLKPLPGIEVGSIFEEAGNVYSWRRKGEKSFVGLPRPMVEGNPAWFRELKAECRHRVQCADCQEMISLN